MNNKKTTCIPAMRITRSKLVEAHREEERCLSEQQQALLAIARYKQGIQAIRIALGSLTRQDNPTLYAIYEKAVEYGYSFDYIHFARDIADNLNFN